MSRSQTRCGVRVSFTAVNGGPMKTIARALAGSLLALALSVLVMIDVHAAELRALAGGSTTGWLNELARRFEQDTGHKLLIQFDSTPNLIKAAASGAPIDWLSPRSICSRTPPRGRVSSPDRPWISHA